MKVAVIGTGTLGTSIAQVFSQCDKVERVFLCKGRPTSKNGKDKIVEVYARLVKKEKLSPKQAENFLAKIESGELEDSKSADILIEAVAEKLEVKREIFEKLDVLCDSHTIFATNTSSLPIQAIGAGLKHSLLGMHFFNPAPVMKLVEVIATDDTTDDMLAQVMQIARDIGKTPVEVREAPGFVVNRVLIPMINEAVSIYAEGVATVKDIDTALQLGANHPMGPLALADLIGLDVVLAILDVMLKETGNNRYLPQPMLKRMVREGKLGRKSGQGFYKY
ncbi:3-hydroxyacyl-CoA dehydrogenase family protein [Selenomonas ruminis]|uniref:3-hydroxybutyryl-CoA dehydrogenase n=1 Tax=Selenomonas ruminis TaxID=2593411 RepID=A0A5D6W890_9FIRM|nr:3-hydroxyacyl-CoA dehydrogenase NAD-binding domain-containing protein [Selenomonas sp. mPRGC5]TYZ24513.1 3-hydroxybutyryl-CoA dehydrogenase [Selenomonas sp. mPRGC5]